MEHEPDMGKKRTNRAVQPPSRTVFSAELLRLLNKTRIPYRVGGTCAVNVYVGLCRYTKDLDVFCRPGDYPRILQAAKGAGFHIEVEDERWIAKIRRGKHFCDVVFGSANMAAPINDLWFSDGQDARIFHVPVKLLGPTELIWSKVFIIDRVKCDINDVTHLILTQHKHVNWRRLLKYMDMHWEVLLIHLLYFRYVYPFKRSVVPRWLMNELFGRLRAQVEMPQPRKRVCRGRIFSRDDYHIDITQWGFADLVGDHAKS
jgi:hypothetical protein